MTEQRQDRPNSVELRAVTPIEDVPPTEPITEPSSGIVIIFWVGALVVLVVSGIAAIFQRLRGD